MRLNTACTNTRSFLIHMKALSSDHNVPEGTYKRGVGASVWVHCEVHRAPKTTKSDQDITRTNSKPTTTKPKHD